MKTINFLVTVSFLILLAAGCEITPTPGPVARTTTASQFSAAAYPRIAVIVADQTGKYRRSKGLLRQIEDEYMQVALSKGYVLATRSDVAHLKKELKFQTADISGPVVAKLGRMLNVPAVLVVSINTINTERYQPAIRVQGRRYYTTTASVSARLIDVSLAEVVWIGSYTGQMRLGDSKGELRAVPLVARVVAKALPSRSQ